VIRRIGAGQLKWCASRFFFSKKKNRIRIISDAVFSAQDKD
jgi:hypothetical protein